MFFISTLLASSSPVVDLRTLWLSRLVNLSAFHGLFQGQHTLDGQHALVGSAIEQLLAHPPVQTDDIPAASSVPYINNFNTPHPMLGLLQAFLTAYTPPSAHQHLDVQPMPNRELCCPEQIAGPSRLTMDDRIPFSAKGKGRAEPAANSIPDDEDEQTAVQLEVDAALAAALQAEEDGIEARRLVSGVAIR